MGEHSSLRLLYKLVRIISFLLLWQFGCGIRAKSTGQVIRSGGVVSHSDPYCPENQGLPCDEAKALGNILETLGLTLEPPITRSYCNDSISGAIKCSCSDTSMNLCHITEIDLSRNQLYGTIPDSLGTLPNLIILNLRDNELTGSIPDSLGNLQFLTSLDLSNNQLSGTIPESLGNLNRLTYLNLGFNQLTGPIPYSLKNLKSLTKLSLNRNFLTGCIPKSLGELSSLQYLSLPYNKLVGRIPDELGNLTKLEYLRLDENLLEYCLPKSLGQLSNLRTLSVTSNNLTGALRQSYSQLTRLVEFRVAGNSLSGPIQRRIRSYIQNWVNLTELNLLGNNFEGPLPRQIFNMTKLKYLLVSDLSNTDFPFPENSNLPNINKLVLRNCLITGQIPSHIGTWTGLTHLDLSFNKLTGEIPKSLNDTSLSDMYLTGNMLSGMVPDWINHTVLYKADLSYNNFINVKYPEATKKQMNLALNNSTYATSQKINIEPNRNSILQMSEDYCPGKSKYHSLFINSGGEKAKIHGKHYAADKSLSNFFVSDKKNWAYTCSGDFWSSSYNSNDYVQNLTCGVSVRDQRLYEKARLCPVSLTYYGFCLRKGSYTVKLHFAEVEYTKNEDYSGLGKRIFDVYVQEKKVLQDFNIKEKAGGPNKVWVETFTADVKKDNLLAIHFYWAGKGSIYNPPLSNGPLISAISVTPNFKVGLPAWLIALIIIACILAPALVSTLLWRMDLMGDAELIETSVDLGGQSYTLKDIKDVTLKFSPKFQIGCRGHSGTVYKAELRDKVVAVKKLHPKLKQQEGDQRRNEIRTLKCLEHENLVKVLDGPSKKNLHLLIYEYIEHTLEQALFGESPLELNWEARFKICKGIAKGLKCLHKDEGTSNNIIHGDINTSNILLDGSPTPTAKLTNFGLERFHGEENPFCVNKERRTLTYMAPEYALQKPITVKADVYSFGVVLLEIVSGERNEECKDGKETVYLLDKASDLHANGGLLELVDRKLSNNYNKKEAIIVLKLAMICINQFPNRRPKMSEVVSVLEGEKTIEQISKVATLAAA